MASLITVKGKYLVRSTVAGKFDVKDFTVDIPYPIAVDMDIKSEVNESMFFIRRFLLDREVRKKVGAEFEGINESYLDFADDLEEDQVIKFVEEGKLVAVDPETLSASEINEFKKPKQFIDVLLMADVDGWVFVEKNEEGQVISRKPMYNDITDYVARTLSVWQGTDIEQQRAELKKFLKIQEAEEVQATKSSKKRASLLKAASKAEAKEAKPKRTRAPRVKQAQAEAQV